MPPTSAFFPKVVNYNCKEKKAPEETLKNFYTYGGKKTKDIEINPRKPESNETAN